MGLLKRVKELVVKIIVRKCTPADIIDLQQISGETFRDTFGPVNSSENVEKYIKESYSFDRLTQEINNPDSDFYFALANGKIAGYLKVNVGDAQTEDTGPTSFEIQRIYVRKAFKRHGIGSKMMDKALTIAKEKHCSPVWLGVWEHNFPAQALYQKFGFKQTGDHAFILGKSRQRDLIMSKKI
ncbi:N-acetyltransferase GCN5 [Lentilactobacillus otakiensis DSM 19908 = JCM 15040]|jgi:ribosomal protein S18 acetylase RimI-like enzyme|uniref:Spermine/spermidine N-acetyltransferase n=1 Tax=Lentilactobacillus otakiensis DSM 19908 = JCM 15040 TaxID=1423780 RepID=S4PNU5_9LACO|nr:N-acetyltransferase GCN5 [Lentilactobacillus otakiensis DSM 19908 = JCM 15040]GAD16085.1 spermine/spermidine N-acetyltransferase [Lentilactobacillus otakiensis DSM 19908 = JCM 15040]